MRTLLKALSFTGLLALAAPAYSQVSVDLHFGTPAPRHEVVIERPYQEAVWTPGHYYYEPRFARNEWREGSWGRPAVARREEVRRDEPRYDNARYDRNRGNGKPDVRNRGEQGHQNLRNDGRQPNERGRG